MIIHSDGLKNYYTQGLINKEVTLQWLALGPTLLDIFIKNLRKGIYIMLIKCAGDMKLGRIDNRREN